MNNGWQGWENGREVEHQSRAILRDTGFLSDHADEGRWVSIEKGPLAKPLQQIAGDYLLNKNGNLVAVEHKAEKKHTGNLFLEIMSNRCLRDRSSHAEFGITPGWMMTQRADLLLYHFLDCDRLYVVDLFYLKRWFWGCKDHQGALGQFWKSFRVQTKNVQKNETCAIVVPIHVIAEHVGVKMFSPMTSSEEQALPSDVMPKEGRLFP